MGRETALPLTFLARMAALLDEEFVPFMAALNQTPVPAIRINTLKISVADFAACSPWPLTPIPWCEQGFFLDRKANAGTHPFHDAGLYYIQDPSTMAVATLLAPQPGQRVLDLCASPGGKTTHMANFLAGQGVLVANDIDRSRAEVLRRTLERWGTRNAVVLNESPERLAARWPGAFDRVLVDAPCSGEGMFRKNDDARTYWSEAHVQGCALRQTGILDSAAQLVRPGGRLAYATCTFAPEENEGVIWRFLQSHPDFELVEPRWLSGFAAGRPDWVAWPAAGEPSDAPALSPPAELASTVRLWPHLAQAEGHFIAILQRTGDETPFLWQPASATDLSKADQQAVDTFWEPLIDLPLPQRLTLHTRDEHTAELLALTDDAPDTSGLRTVRPGWHLGTLRKGRFEPSHALAVALTSDQVANRLDEPAGSELVARYLRGETLPVDGPAGWLLVTVAGFPLGWGKRVGSTIKNHYPRGLRWG